jgi:hypothetical protein
LQQPLFLMMAAKTVLKKDDLLHRLRQSTRSLKVKVEQPTVDDLASRKIPDERFREQDLVSTHSNASQ